MDYLKEKIKEIIERESKEAKRLLYEATSQLEKTCSSIYQVNGNIQVIER